MTKNTYLSPKPFRTLELQLKLDDLEKRWEEAKELYMTNNLEEIDTEEIVKLTVEKIRILAEYNLINYEA